MRQKTHTIALCGVLGALATALLISGGVIAPAGYAAPALAGIVLLILAVEVGRRAALLCFIAVGILGLLLCPDPEPSLLFCMLLGWYPLAKPFWDALRPRFAGLAAKAAIFHFSVAAAFWLLAKLTGDALWLTLQALPAWGLAGILLLVEVTFWLYDLALGRIALLYKKVLRPRLTRARRG